MSRFDFALEKKNENQTLIKEQCICNLTEVVILEKIKIARGKDKEIVRVVEKMKKAEVKVLRGGEWQVEGDLVLNKGKVCAKKWKVKSGDNLVTL